MAYTHTLSFNMEDLGRVDIGTRLTLLGIRTGALFNDEIHDGIKYFNIKTELDEAQLRAKLEGSMFFYVGSWPEESE